VLDSNLVPLEMMSLPLDRAPADGIIQAIASPFLAALVPLPIVFRRFSTL
jgi:hypothetical protein